MLDIIGNLFGQPLNIMIQDHEIDTGSDGIIAGLLL